MPSQKFVVALIQMSCGPDRKKSRARPSSVSAMRPRVGRRSSACPNLFQTQYFCQREDHACSISRSRFPARPLSEAFRCGPPVRRRARRFAFRKARRRRLSQHRGDLRHRRRAARHLPQDAHPRRPALLREVLFHARRPGISRLRYAARDASARWSAGTSGIRKARALPPCRARVFFSTPPRSAGIPPRRRSSAWLSTTPGAPSSARMPSPTASTSAVVNRVGFETRQHSRQIASGPGPRILGRIILLRSLRPRARRSSHDQGGDPARRSRPEAAGGHPPQLAFSARSPHRQLRAHHQPDDRLVLRNYSFCNNRRP